MDSSNVQNEDKLLGYLPFGISSVQTPEKQTWKTAFSWELILAKENIRNLQQEVSELRKEIRSLRRKLEPILSNRRIVRKTLEHKKRMPEKDPWELIKKIGPIDIDIERLDHFLNNF